MASFIDPDVPEWFLAWCHLCGKRGAVMLCYPADDACCPHCGTRMDLRRAQPEDDLSPYEVLPSTPRNQQAAQKVVDDVTKTLEQFKRRGTCWE